MKIYQLLFNPFTVVGCSSFSVLYSNKEKRFDVNLNSNEVIRVACVNVAVTNSSFVKRRIKSFMTTTDLIVAGESSWSCFAVR